MLQVAVHGVVASQGPEVSSPPQKTNAKNWNNDVQLSYGPLVCKSADSTEGQGTLSSKLKKGSIHSRGLPDTDHIPEFLLATLRHLHEEGVLHRAVEVADDVAFGLGRAEASTIAHP